jgi:hypothetical protein
MAVSVLACDHALAERDARSPGTLDERSQEALQRAPHAARWAEEFSRGFSAPPTAVRRRVAPRTVRLAVEGVAAACVPDPDAALRGLLAGAIEECAARGRPAADRHEEWPVRAGLG